MAFLCGGSQLAASDAPGSGFAACLETPMRYYLLISEDEPVEPGDMDPKKKQPKPVGRP